MENGKWKKSILKAGNLSYFNILLQGALQAMPNSEVNASWPN
jgi:hypothetical protein